MKFYDLSRSMCEWDRLHEWRVKIREAIASNKSGVIPPFHLLSVTGMGAEEQRACADLWMQARIESSRADRVERAFSFTIGSKPKIRLGYLSSDFHEHATSLLLVELFEAHNRERFEVFAYSYGPDDGTGKLASNCLTTPLNNICAYTQHLEALYQFMWLRYLNGQNPAALFATNVRDEE